MEDLLTQVITGQKQWDLFYYIFRLAGKQHEVIFDKAHWLYNFNGAQELSKCVHKGLRKNQMSE